MHPPIYQTPNYILQPYQLKDEERFVEMGTDPAVVAFMGGATGDPARERALFHKIFQLYEKNDSKRWFWIWGIYNGDKLCGHLEMKETENTSVAELEIVYMLHPAERKKGIMTEVLDFLKSNQGLWNRQLIATVDPENRDSIHLLERWGIAKEIEVENEEGAYLKLLLKVG